MMMKMKMMVMMFAFCVVAAAADVPAMFIFGDSLVDAGNNNELITLAQANFPPYGKEFDNAQPTGRFANGRLIPDFIASKLGLPFAPPYLNNNNNVDILHGINFASAGSGLLPSTGLVFGQHISMSKQVESFKSVINKNITSLIGRERTSNLVSRSLYYITLGSNDIVNNYYLTPASPFALQYTPQAFQKLLISQYHTHIKDLYEQGARKFILASLTALGCSPINLLRYNVIKSGECVDFLNTASSNFNSALKSSVSQWNQQLPDAHIVYANSYDHVLEIVKNPQFYDYQVSDKACCSGIGKNGAIVFCLRNVATCTNSSSYLYWDEFHPSSRVYNELAERFWESSSSTDVFPLSVSQLASL